MRILGNPVKTGGMKMTRWIWYFWIYSFLGFLLEKLFAAATHAERQGRKCFLLLPMCPVYGLGMLAVLVLPKAWTGTFLSLALWGGLAATAVEYAVHWACERFLGVRFWDYSGVPGNLRGRVCPPFTLVWGLLTAAAVRLVHPAVVGLAAQIPAAWTCGFFLFFAADAACTARFLWETHDVEALRRVIG